VLLQILCRRKALATKVTFEFDAILFGHFVHVINMPGKRSFAHQHFFTYLAHEHRPTGVRVIFAQYHALFFVIPQFRVEAKALASATAHKLLLDVVVLEVGTHLGRINGARTLDTLFARFRLHVGDGFLVEPLD